MTGLTMTGLTTTGLTTTGLTTTEAVRRRADPRTGGPRVVHLAHVATIGRSHVTEGRGRGLRPSRLCATIRPGMHGLVITTAGASGECRSEPGHTLSRAAANSVGRRRR